MRESWQAACAVLERHFGFSSFRRLQGDVVRSVLAGRDTLGVLPTGGGKSVCFQVPAMVLGGYTLVVSPLISLMQDQVAAALARGIPAVSLAGPMSAAEIAAALDTIAGGSRLLYTSPERLQRLVPELERRQLFPCLLAVDEAHCIAEWGHDFRPSYRQLRRARYRLRWPPVVALTGSATPAVRRDISSALGFGGRGRASAEHLGSFDRRNLWFGVRRVGSERERLEALLALLAHDDAMSIVYAPTRKATEGISAALRDAGHRAVAYHAGLDRTVRSRRLDAFLYDEVDVVVATSAFGMGIDKPTVRLVVHWSMPPTPESYYQEAGRAGRDGTRARCILLYRPGDAEVHRRQLDVTFPPRRTLEEIWSGQLAPVRVPRAVAESAERLRRELHPERGPVDWRPVEARRTAAARRIAAVEHYARTRSCHRTELLGYFGERAASCTGCDRCPGTSAAFTGSPEASRRLHALRIAMHRRGAPWPGALLDDETLSRLAWRPPTTVEELAAVPGVGARIASRWGALLVEGLADCPVSPTESALVAALAGWRARTASLLGVPAIELLSLPAMRALAAERPTDPAAIARIARLGPRGRARFAKDLAAILTETPAPPPPYSPGPVPCYP